MTPDPHSILKSAFGFDAFRPGQQGVVESILRGENILAVMPTGAGKSLCYQVPALLLDRPTIVVSPLVALMDDQVAALRANGVGAASIHSGKDRSVNVEEWRAFASGEAKMLYLSPERLMTDRMIAALKKLNPGLFVVDEAHCISKWGASFRPEYEQLSHLKKLFPEAHFAAFTATADEVTRRDIAEKLFDGRGEIVVRGFDRPNLRLNVAPKKEWRRQLLNFLDTRRNMSGIIYCLSRRSTEEVAAFLKVEGFNALPYHAGLSADVRKENQEAFMAEKAVVMVATIAFGMGIDKPDIRYVYHLNMPASMEAYYQEIGRAGRDGQAADVEMLYGFDDIRMRRQFIEQEDGEIDHKRREHKRLDALLAYCEAVTCRRATLLTYFGESAEPCGNCDICLDPPKLVDGTDHAQLLLEAIQATGQMFGIAHVIDVLRGSANQKVKEKNHDRLGVFGKGSALSKAQWQTIARQVLASDYLSIDIEGYGGLRLTAQGAQQLRDKQPIFMRELVADKPSKKRARQQRLEQAVQDGVDQDLLSHLKALRRELAQERGVPAYIIFSDSTLIDMCLLKPATLDDMALVSGVGPKKLDDFGQVFLRAVNG